MSELTDLLTELDKAATPGPLSVSDKFGAAHGFEWHVETEDGHGIWVAKCQVQADAALIVALRNHLPEILRELRQQHYDQTILGPAEQMNTELRIADLERRLSEAEKAMREARELIRPPCEERDNLVASEVLGACLSFLKEPKR